VIGVAIYMAHEAKKKRCATWEAVARNMGFAFQPAGSDLHETFAKFKLFSQGHDRTSEHVLTGEVDGMEVRVCDYSYVTGSGKNRTTHFQTLCLLTHEHLDLPHFFLRKEIRVFDFLGKLFGGQDINFDEDPEFLRRVRVAGRERSRRPAIFRTTDPAGVSAAQG
jgi:hypothetical protein